MNLSNSFNPLPMSIRACFSQSMAMHSYTQYLRKCMDAEFCNDPKQHIKTVVVFAIVFSGLACTEQLHVFYNELRERKLKLSEKNGNFRYELKYTMNGHPSNLRVSDDSEECFSYSSRCLDSLTSIVIHGFLSRRNVVSANLPTFDEVITLIHRDLYEVTPGNFSKQRLIQQLFVCGQMMTNSETPEFLFQFATGATFSGSSESDSSHYIPKTQSKYNKSAGTKLLKPANLKVSERLVSVCESNTTLPSDNAFINKLLNICENENRHFNRNRTIERVNKHINSNDPRSIPAEIIAQWISSGLHDKSKNLNYRWGEGKRTPISYLKMIKDDWLEQFEEIDITEINDVDSEDIYWTFVDKKREKRPSVTNILPLLYKFIAFQYPESIESPEFILEEDGVNFVRSRLINENMFQRCIYKLIEHHLNKDSHFKRALEVLVTIIFRLGLRPKEAFNLKLKNISFGEVCEIEIHQNRESGKSASADRRIRASLFLKRNELESLQKLYDARIFQAGDNTNAILFSQCIFQDIKFDYRTVNTPAAEYLSEIVGYRTVFYQCRHTFITNLMLICFANPKVAAEMTCYDLHQIEEIKLQFSVNPSTMLDQISSFVGHLSPSTTLKSYAHRVDLCLINYLENEYHGLCIKSLAKLMNVRHSDIKRILNAKSLESKNDKQRLSEHVRNALTKHVKATKQLAHELSAVDEVNKDHWNPLAPTLDLTMEIGQHLSKSIDVIDIANGLAIDIDFCKCVRDSMLKLREEGFVATNDEAKLEKIDLQVKQLVVPNIKAITHGEVLLVANALVKLKPLEKNYDTLAKRFLMSPVTKAYILYSDIDELVTSLDLLKAVVPLNRWKIRYESVFNQPRSKKVEQIQKLLPVGNLIQSEEKVHDANRYPDGRFYLHHIHENEGRHLLFKDDWMVYSDNIVRVSFYWAEVFSRSHELIKIIMSKTNTKNEMACKLKLESTVKNNYESMKAKTSEPNNPTTQESLQLKFFDDFGMM